MSNDIGDYYERKRKQAELLREKIKEAEKANNVRMLKILREQLEQAEYTGD